MIYRNITDNEELWWNLWPSESYFALNTDLVAIKQRCCTSLPEGAVSDWKGAIVNGLALCFGDIPHQRCLAHVVRDLKQLLPKYSPIQATQELRIIGLELGRIRTKEDKENWLLWFMVWEAFFGEVLKQKSYPEQPETTKHKWWYTHGNIRRAYKLLIKDQHHIFEFLDHPLIPNTNNSLEGVNSDLKTKLVNHRGMKPMQQYHFICWYLTFKKVKNIVDLHKLWDYLKKKL